MQAQKASPGSVSPVSPHSFVDVDLLVTKPFPFSSASIEGLQKKPISKATLEATFGKRLTARALSICNVEPKDGMISKPGKVKRVLTQIVRCGENTLTSNLDNAEFFLKKELEANKGKIKEEKPLCAVTKMLVGMQEKDARAKVLDSIAADPEMQRKQVCDKQMRAAVRARVKEDAEMMQLKESNPLTGERPEDTDRLTGEKLKDSKEVEGLLRDNLIIASGCMTAYFEKRQSWSDALKQKMERRIMEALRFAPEMETYIPGEQIEKIVVNRIQEYCEGLKEIRIENYDRAKGIIARSPKLRKLGHILLAGLKNKSALDELLSNEELEDLIEETRIECFYRTKNYRRAEDIVLESVASRQEQSRLLKFLGHKKELCAELSDRQLRALIVGANDELNKLPVRIQKEGVKEKVIEFTSLHKEYAPPESDDKKM